jgi:hypothetical protein
LILRHSAISGFFPLLRGKKYIKLQLVEILLIRKRSGTAWTPSILGPPVRTQTSHKGTPNTSLHLAYNLETAYGARARKHNWNSGGLGRARAIPKQWSIHSGTTSAHTKQSFWDHKCAHKSFTEEPGIQTSLTLAYQPTTSDGARVEPIFLHLKRWQEGTSDTKKELYYQGGTHSGTTSAHTNLLPQEHQVHPSLTFAILPPTTDQPLMEPKFTN